MDYNEVKKVLELIDKDLKSGNYEVRWCEPNNIRMCKAPDGRTYYLFVDMDGPRSCNYFGECAVDVGDYEFTCDLGSGEYKSYFFDELDEEYSLSDGTVVNREYIEKEVVDMLNSRKDICFCECTNLDWQAELFLPKDAEYYFPGSDDCPVDISDGEFTPPEDLDYGTVDYNGREYYLVDEPEFIDGEELRAVDSEAKPSDDGYYETVLFTVKYDSDGVITVTDCDEYNVDDYNGVEG